jgi:hypothetical protein
VVDGAALEMLCRATYRGFESHLLRIWIKKSQTAKPEAFLVVYEDLDSHPSDCLTRDFRCLVKLIRTYSPKHPKST